MDYRSRTQLFDYLRNKIGQPSGFGLIPAEGKISINIENRAIIELNDKI